MTIKDAADLIQQGGVIALMLIIGWAIFTRRVITRGEFDRFVTDAAKRETDLKQDLSDVKRDYKEVSGQATAELRQSAATNARLVETLANQFDVAERIRRGHRREGVEGE